MFKKIAAWFGKSWPAVKTTALGLGSAGLTAAASGAFGPKAAAGAAAVGTFIALFSHRPQDNAAATGTGEGQ